MMKHPLRTYVPRLFASPTDRWIVLTAFSLFGVIIYLILNMWQ